MQRFVCNWGQTGLVIDRPNPAQMTHLGRKLPTSASSIYEYTPLLILGCSERDKSQA
jgi:hypothetical protein